VYKEELQKIIERLNPKLKNILITHYGIDGVFTNDKIKVNSEIKEVNFKAFHKVFIGHYHNASNPSKNIHYIGSTDARNFGEDDNKGATIVYSDLSFERVKFDFKPYRKIVVEDFSLESLKRLQEGISTNEENIRVEFVGRREDFLKVDKKELEGMGVDVVFSDTTNISPDEKDNTVLIKMERKDVLKHFIEYCAVNNIEKNKSVKIIKMF
jgi:DNA repair protein SbcD/Mre11